MEPENLLLDRYILAQARSPDPKVCFVPTASGDQDNYTRRFYDAFTTLHCRLISDGWGADDGCAVHFVDGAVHAIVSSRKESHAYRLTRVDGVAREVRHEARYLGAANQP
jgi:peptidase E